MVLSTTIGHFEQNLRNGRNELKQVLETNNVHYRRKTQLELNLLRIRDYKLEFQKNLQELETAYREQNCDRDLLDIQVTEKDFIESQAEMVGLKLKVEERRSVHVNDRLCELKQALHDENIVRKSMKTEISHMKEKTSSIFLETELNTISEQISDAMIAEYFDENLILNLKSIQERLELSKCKHLQIKSRKECELTTHEIEINGLKDRLENTQKDSEASKKAIQIHKEHLEELKRHLKAINVCILVCKKKLATGAVNFHIFSFHWFRTT